jgi:hypothetical protein
MGYTHVREYAGGKSDWVDAGLPLEADGECDPGLACEDEVAEAPPG